jgi:uncharacterized repeat protein (TIGR04076 family)
MVDENQSNESEDGLAAFFRAENRYYQEVTIANVQGECPYGHKVGDQFKVTAMNSGNICGSLLHVLLGRIVTLHYGGSLLWEKNPNGFEGVCPEAGKVQVKVRRVEQEEPTLLKVPFTFNDMTGKGYPLLDKYKLIVEVRDIAVNCYWGHKVGDTFEVDPFNVGGACCLLYGQMYPYIHVLISGAAPPWAFDEHTVVGECPDSYDRLSFGLTLKER